LAPEPIRRPQLPQKPEWPQRPSQSRGCAANATHFQCSQRIHECIPRYLLCDGEFDCTDGSDEFTCPSSIRNKREISGPLEIRANKNFFTSGDNLEILCSLPGVGASSTSKGSSFTWKKMNGDLPENCQVNGAKLSIFNLQNDNDGVYRCQLTTPFDTIFADYVIVLEGL